MDLLSINHLIDLCIEMCAQIDRGIEHSPIYLTLWILLHDDRA